MNIMTGYLGATEGLVIIDGHDILEEPEAAKKRIGYLPEIPPLYMDMTVDEYLEFAACLNKLPKAGQKDAIQEVTELVKITDVRKRLIRNLSKGYRQRVGMAQAILGKPSVITVSYTHLQVHIVLCIHMELVKLVVGPGQKGVWNECRTLVIAVAHHQGLEGVDLLAVHAHHLSLIHI